MNHFHDEDFGRQQFAFSTELALPHYSKRKNLPESKTGNWFRSALLRQMKGLEKGEICVHEQRQPLQCLGRSDSSQDLQAHIVVGDPGFYRRILFGGTIGAAESYMEGEWVSDNLTDVIRIIIRNLRKMTLLEKSVAWLKNRLYWLQHAMRRNSVEGSRKNIHAHYDLGNEFYRLFLDPTMNYSSGIFAAANEKQPGSMHDASLRKMRTISEKLCLRSTDHVLEIGTGWGGLAIFMAQNYGCRVTTTTISKEQYRYAIEAVQQAGLTDRIEVLLKDYRHLKGSFDKLVSIEMIEAVGHQYYDEYFAKCSSLLNDQGALLLQAITIGEQHYDYHIRHVDFIRRYVFPGGCLPSIGALNRSAIRKTDMRMLHTEDLTPHYVHTLRRWREAFMDQLDRVTEMGYGDAFIRLWHFYLCYCEAAFAERRVHLAHLIYCKPGCRIDPSTHYGTFNDREQSTDAARPPRNHSRRSHASQSQLNNIPDQLLAQKHGC